MYERLGQKGQKWKFVFSAILMVYLILPGIPAQLAETGLAETELEMIEGGEPLTYHISHFV